ncbi:MAG: hypothetical protein H6R15_736 [Proteobacteria bacterium]|nr:hypothetical protein [Pseudomonadota bacterium]
MRVRGLTKQLAIALLAAAACQAQAAPDEIQVYTQEIDEPGEFGLEYYGNTGR